MTYQTCPNCGERVYALGCTWCDEDAYIAEQIALDAQQYPARPKKPEPIVTGDRSTPPKGAEK